MTRLFANALSTTHPTEENVGSFPGKQISYLGYMVQAPANSSAAAFEKLNALYFHLLTDTKFKKEFALSILSVYPSIEIF